MASLSHTPTIGLCSTVNANVYRTLRSPESIVQVDPPVLRLSATSTKAPLLQRCKMGTPLQDGITGWCYAAGNKVVGFKMIIAYPAGPLFRLLIRRGDVSTHDDAWMLYAPVQLPGFEATRGDPHLPHRMTTTACISHWQKLFRGRPGHALQCITASRVQRPQGAASPVVVDV